MTLKQIAIGLVGEAEAEKYLTTELPLEEPDREFELVASDASCEIYRDCDVYLIHTSIGLDTGMWDELPDDYPELSKLIYAAQASER